MTDTTVKRFHQAFICYGPHHNSKLWTEYGFLIPARLVWNSYIVSVLCTICRVEIWESVTFRVKIKHSTWECSNYSTLPHDCIALFLLSTVQMSNVQCFIQTWNRTAPHQCFSELFQFYPFGCRASFILHQNHFPQFVEKGVECKKKCWIIKTEL